MYKALLFGSGAARRTVPPALIGEVILADPDPEMDEELALVLRGGNGGGGMWEAPLEPF